MSTSSGDYGEQGDYATDGAFEDTLGKLGLADDEADPGAPPGDGDEEDDTAPIPGGGKLLEQRDPAKLFKTIDGIVERQAKVRRNREEKAKHWGDVRSGRPFCFLEKNEDRSVFKATRAPGVDEVGGQPVPNKMDDLCNKIISQILADDFLPDPKPNGDADSDRGAADLAKKFLRADGMTSGTDDRQLLRDALNMNISAATAGVLVWADPTAGGWRPMQVMAHPRAEDASTPLYAPQQGPDGMPVVTADGPMLEKATSPVLRYVAEVPGARDPLTGQRPTTLVFTENAAEAKRQWLPKERRKLLSVNQLVTVPQSATVFDASSITLLMYDSLGEAKKRFKVLRTLKGDALKSIVQWRPKRWKAIVPEAHRPKDSEGAGTVHDDSLIFWYEHYCRISPDYPDGAQICISGNGTTEQAGGFVFLRDTLRDDVEVDDGKRAPVLRDPPVSQFLCTPDIEDGDAMGMALLARFGGGKEAWDQIWSGVFDAMFQALNRNVFLPGMSPVTREDMNRRDGDPITVMTKDDLPMYEEPATLPDFVPAMMDKIEMAMNSGAGTNETSNGLDSSFSESGIAKQIAIKTARTALAQYWQSTVKGLCYYWRIKLQLAQARLTVPQMVALSGAESAYKQPWFVGADMCGVNEVALQSGSGTMMQPTEKAQHLGFLQQNAWLDPEQAGELARSSMTDDLGLPPNIHEEAVNREIAAWSKGPPAGWLEQQAAYEQQMAAVQQELQGAAQTLMQAQPGLDPAMAMQGAQAALQQSGRQMPQAPGVPFEDRPNHQEQLVAVYRHRAFSRMMSTVEYTKQPAPWRVPFNERYEQARQAAGVPTVAEQQAAAQAQAQAQSAQVQAGEQTKVKTAEDDRAFKAQEADKDRAAKREESARANMSREAVAAAKPRPQGAPRAALPA